MKIVNILSGVVLVAITAMASATSLDTSIPTSKHVSSEVSTRPSSLVPTTISVEFSGWVHAAQAKQQLLPRILAECPQGFTLSGESYKPLTMGKILLSIHYDCVS